MYFVVLSQNDYEFFLKSFEKFELLEAVWDSLVFYRGFQFEPIYFCSQLFMLFWGGGGVSLPVSPICGWIRNQHDRKAIALEDIYRRKKKRLRTYLSKNLWLS